MATNMSVGGLELLAGVGAAPAPAQPFSLQQVSAGLIGADPGSGEMVEGPSVQRFGVVVVGEQRSGPGQQAERPPGAGGGRSAGEAVRSASLRLRRGLTPAVPR